jgi:hypothetical protein
MRSKARSPTGPSLSPTCARCCLTHGVCVRHRLYFCRVHEEGCQILGTMAYIVTSDGARKLAAHFELQGGLVDLPVDHFIAVMHNYLDPSFVFASTRFPIFPNSGRPSTIGHSRAFCIGHPWQVKAFKKLMISVTGPACVAALALTILLCWKPLQGLALRARAALRRGYEPVEPPLPARVPA